MFMAVITEQLIIGKGFHQTLLIISSKTKYCDLHHKHVHIIFKILTRDLHSIRYTLYKKVYLNNWPVFIIPGLGLICHSNADTLICSSYY